MSVIFYLINGKTYISSTNNFIIGNDVRAGYTRPISNELLKLYPTAANLKSVSGLITEEQQDYNYVIIGIINGVAHELYKLYFPYNVHSDDTEPNMEFKSYYVYPNIYTLKRGDEIIRQYNTTHKKSITYTTPIDESYEDALFERIKLTSLSERDVERFFPKTTLESPLFDPVEKKISRYEQSNPNRPPPVKTRSRKGGTQKNKYIKRFHKTRRN
jgi:hypothetical protein